jgi:hypothetical protein
LGTIHLIYIALVLRIVCRSVGLERHAIANPNSMLFRILCCSVIFLADFMMLSALLARANYAAFELCSVLIRLVAWMITVGLQINVSAPCLPRPVRLLLNMFVCNLFGASCQAYYAGLPEREEKNYLLFVSWLFLLAGYTMKLHLYYLIDV